MQQWKCSTCGEYHKELLMDIAFAKPQQYLDVPDEERSARTWLDYPTNSDLCVVDNSFFLIRAFLPLKVEEEIFRFGVWAKIQKDDFLMYGKSNWNLAAPPIFQGEVASIIPGYPPTLELQVDVKLIGYNDRPVLKVHSTEHPLVTEQEQGITLTRVHEILEICLPEWFA